MEIKVFGEKEQFCIEFTISNVKNKTGKARFWIEGKPFGEFKVTHKLSYLVSGLKQVLQLGDSLWDETFEGKSYEEILGAFLMIGKDIYELTEADYELATRFQKIVIFFGDQFDTINNVIYSRNNKLFFVWLIFNDYSGKTKLGISHLSKLQHASVEISVFKKVSEDCIGFLESELGL